MMIVVVTTIDNFVLFCYLLAVAPERIWKWGAPVRSESGGTDPARAPPLFWR